MLEEYKKIKTISECQNLLFNCESELQSMMFKDEDKQKFHDILNKYGWISRRFQQIDDLFVITNNLK